MIRAATPADVPVIHEMICELARYQKIVHKVHITEEQLDAALFGELPSAFVLLAQVNTEQAVGFAMWFPHFSVWRGVRGIHLDNLYVRPSLRRHGYGRALLGKLALICAERGYEELEWSVLSSNTLAKNFYASLGAQPQAEGAIYRVDKEELTTLASSML